MLAVQSVCVRGASYASYPNPVGEAAYRPHLLRDMLPIAVIVSALLLSWLLHAVQRKRALAIYASASAERAFQADLDGGVE